MTDQDERQRHGLPGHYDTPEKIASQEEGARWVQFESTQADARVVLEAGRTYEIWPAGDIFNVHGTWLGELMPVMPPGEKRPQSPTYAEFMAWRREQGFPDE